MGSGPLRAWALGGYGAGRHLEGAEKTLGGTLMGHRLWMMLRVSEMLEDGGKSLLDTDGKLSKTVSCNNVGSRNLCPVNVMALA